MKIRNLTLPLILLAVSACSGGGSGSSTPALYVGPCDELIAEMFEYLGTPDGEPAVIELRGDTGIFYSYERHGGDVGFFFGPSFDGCEADIFT